jgi:hypothetical protein
MDATQVFEQFTPPSLVALSVVDTLARALRLSGEFPPPLGEVQCDIVAATAPAAVTFDPPRRLYTFRNRSGYLVLDGSYWSTTEPAHRWPLAPGTYRIRVSGEFYQDAEFLMPWPLAADARRVLPVPLPAPNPQPTDPQSVELLPAPSYPLPDVTASRFQLGPTIVRGSAYRADGTPVQGALAEITNVNLPVAPPAGLPPLGAWPFLSAKTDARGDWTLVLPDRRYFDNTPEIPPGNPPAQVSKQIAVRIQYPGGPVTRQVNVLLGREYALKNTALRGQVLGRGGRPITGAAIKTSTNAPTSTSRADGTWFLYFDLNQVAVPNVTVTATTPSGAVATASVPLTPQATVVVPTFQFP